MATSGTFTSSRYGHSSYGPWLTLAWTQVSQSVANNTTTLDLTLRFHWDQDINYTFNNKKGSVQGNSYTYSGSISGVSGSRVLKTQRVTIDHTSNGSKSVTLSANITNLGMYWYSGGTTIGTMSVSGVANLETIPRASTMSAFSFNANLKNAVANQIKYTVSKKSTAFRHQIQLRDGDTVLRTWDNVDSDGASTLTLTATEVNTLLSKMPSSTTKSFTLRVATRSSSGGSWIGSAVSRNATATVHADVKPTVSALTVSQTGNTVSTHYLQGKSKIKASFTRSAGYGATLSSSSITVRRKTSNTDVQNISSNDGTTAKAVSLNGTYQAQGTARDSRGRTNVTAWKEFTVTAYSSPKITSFTAVRNATTPTTVNIYRAATHTSLGGANSARLVIDKRTGNGAWSAPIQDSTDSSGAWGNSVNSTGNSVTTSYEFRVTLTDAFGETSTASVTVSTQQVVLDIHKNEGVGIGKLHEQGALDIGGDVYVNGVMPYNGVATTSMASNDRQWHNMPAGAYYVGANGVELGYPENWIIIHHTVGGLVVQQALGKDRTYTRRFNSSQPMDWSQINAQVGSSSTGNWMKFGDGTLIATQMVNVGSRRSVGGGTLANPYRSGVTNWSFPFAFVSPPRVTASTRVDNGDASIRAVYVSMQHLTETLVSLQGMSTSSNTTAQDVEIRAIAIGRWK